MKIFTKAKTKYILPIDISEWNSPLWDFHNHILPGVDDGSPSMDESVMMIKKEISDGVTDILLTPHYLPGRSDMDEIRSAFDELKKKVDELGLSVKLHLGAELYYTASLKEELDKFPLTLDGSEYVLVEFETDISYSYLKHAVMDILSSGVKPVIAHIERYDCIYENMKILDELKKMGVLLQLNANTLANRDGAKMYIPYIRNGYISFIGSDCHSMDWRPPNMSLVIPILCGELGLDKARELLNAGRIIHAVL